MNSCYEVLMYILFYMQDKVRQNKTKQILVFEERKDKFPEKTNQQREHKIAKQRNSQSLK